MNGIKKTFDKWAQNGRAELMENEHGNNVTKFFQTITFDEPFTFLDVGCGNGWVVRKIAKENNCKKSIGIDISNKMIIQAKKKSSNKKEEFFHTDVESWDYKGKFNFIFSMESIYYADSIEIALEKIYKLLKPGGQFFCGTDFYTENKSTARWANIMKIQMHLHSEKEWRQFFKNAGFQVKTKRNGKENLELCSLQVKNIKSKTQIQEQYIIAM